jgi:CubicO group peptidase (beta-lactamase class C family)
MAQSEDWMRFVLSRPVAMDPGTRFRYSSGSSLLLSGILQNATGEQVHDYVERHLFDRLGIPVYAWYHNLEHPKRWSHTGGGLLMRSRDLLKLGMLIVDRGTWHGEQIVPASWIDALSTPYLRISDAMDYGYQWYLRPLEPGAAPRNAVVHGWGWGGQFVFAVPELDLVVVFTSGNFANKDLERTPIQLLYDYVIAAVRPVD